MSVGFTIFWILVVLAIIGIAFWRDGLPRANGKIYWFSWKPVLLIAVVVFIVLVTHLVNSFGIETGQGRRRF